MASTSGPGAHRAPNPTQANNEQHSVPPIQIGTPEAPIDAMGPQRPRAGRNNRLPQRVGPQAPQAGARQATTANPGLFTRFYRAIGENIYKPDWKKDAAPDVQVVTNKLWKYLPGWTVGLPLGAAIALAVVFHAAWIAPLAAFFATPPGWGVAAGIAVCVVALLGARLYYYLRAKDVQQITKKFEERLQEEQSKAYIAGRDERIKESEAYTAGRDETINELKAEGVLPADYTGNPFFDGNA